ncbi:hypothetical protein AVW09_00770 [Microbacterium sp. T32]|nr:hypothetical protein AVW09_00770 [Microbacterium sp. T32]
MASVSVVGVFDQLAECNVWSSYETLSEFAKELGIDGEFECCHRGPMLMPAPTLRAVLQLMI